MQEIPLVHEVDNLFSRESALLRVIESIQHVNDTSNGLEVTTQAGYVHYGTVTSHEHRRTHVHWEVFTGFEFSQTFWNK